MAFNPVYKKFPWTALLLLFVAFGALASSILPIHGALMQPEYEKIVTTPFHYGNTTTQETRIPTSDVIVKNEALIDIYCYLYANSASNITLLLGPDYWNLTEIPVAIGQSINVTVTNGVLDLPADVFAILQIDILRTSADDEVQGVLILNVITSGWKKAPWEGFVGLGVLLLLALVKRSKRKLR